ncbi:riboflavin synthase [Actinocrinis puniceicyclus]|uniref:Riboflavin synthase n=1 Tax=Actinocrinis puniceicyclus TaxID=977794 RepID=A0A8J8BFF4_9ACTN|nr:riboflavin synthase [Actinocrinis puniceicyclus]MBS2966126.1 riboflavin synthase [Actinocrinis puniceicyclus]
MFTGIIEELGEVLAVEILSDAARFTIRGPVVTADATHGASIAVNGVCLTVTDPTGADTLAEGRFTADVMAESLSRSSLGDLAPGDRVNLERPMSAAGRFGGHIVQGHVDGTGTVLARSPSEHWEVVSIGLPARLARYVVEKGSITVDGISLTVASVSDAAAAGESAFTVSLIPATLAQTTLGIKRPGARVNLEVDVIAKYTERLLAGPARIADPEGAAPEGSDPEGSDPEGAALAAASAGAAR